MDGNGMDMGSGFMDSSSTGAKGGSEKKTYRDKAILPVTIRQLLDATGGENGFNIDGAEINQIKIMGIVVEVEPHSTTINFKINDGSGIIDCKVHLPPPT